MLPSQESVNVFLKLFGSLGVFTSDGEGELGVGICESLVVCFRPLCGATWRARGFRRRWGWPLLLSRSPTYPLLVAA